MKKMIDELWDGEISPQDTLISDNQEYRELQHRQSQNKAELLEALSDEQKELLEKFCATEIELNCKKRSPSATCTENRATP